MTGFWDFSPSQSPVRLFVGTGRSIGWRAVGFGWIWADLSRFQKCVRLLFAFSGRDAGVPRLIWVAGGSTGAGVDMSVNAAS